MLPGPTEVRLQAREDTNLDVGLERLGGHEELERRRREGVLKRQPGRIFYLAEFTEQHSSQVLGDNATVEPLLEINMAVLRGLRQIGAA